MIKRHDTRTVYLKKAGVVTDATLESTNEACKKHGLGTMDEETFSRLHEQSMSYGILSAHNTSKDEKRLSLRFDAMASHDITYVGIVQTAMAAGLTNFPMPYVLTNCHNSLCAVGGTINEDDHMFGLSAAKKFGGIYVPAHLAVIHQYMREMLSGCGKMILGSDSHTRYGALGTMGVGEGGPELVKQLLGKTYEIERPKTVLIHLRGTPRPGVGPQDVALAIIGEVFEDGFVKNAVMEFGGPGIESLSMDYRNGIDVMTTETACLSSIWPTDDDKVRAYYEQHGRPQDYKPMAPSDVAAYDAALMVDLSAVEPMMALPFHPSNTMRVRDVIKNAKTVFEQIAHEIRSMMPEADVTFCENQKDGSVYIDQGIIAGCSGGSYENIAWAADALRDADIGNDAFALSVYPQSQPVFYALNQQGAMNELMRTGAVIKTAFCGPCFGAGDVPSNQAFSLRHTTRNFASREGSKPGDGQIASVALADSRTIAATAYHKGRLTPGDEMERIPEDRYGTYEFHGDIYKNRVYRGVDMPKPDTTLRYGPNIKPWPEMQPLKEHLVLQVASIIRDKVTTTDELIPSGETSSYRSNPLKLAEFALGRVDPGYVGRAKKIKAMTPDQMAAKLQPLNKNLDADLTSFGSVIYANKPGDGSAREQAASCQKVLGAWGNIAVDYATKRYRSNLVNWGIFPFIVDKKPDLALDDVIVIENLKAGLLKGKTEFDAVLVGAKGVQKISLSLPALDHTERDILIEGCLINYYRSRP